MSCGIDYAPELRARGFRVTAQRMAVLHTLRHARARLSPHEVYQQAREALPGLTETTVYRTLDFLSQNGLVWPIRTKHGHLAYELAGKRHHHLVCRECGAELEVDHKLLSSMYTRLEAASGYKLTDDHMTLFGICPDCQKTTPRSQG